MHHRRWIAAIATPVVAVLLGVFAGCSSSGSHTSHAGNGGGPEGTRTSDTGGSAGQKPPVRTGYFVYWDQNEEEGYLHEPSGKTGKLVPPWDPNGQLCLLGDGTGRFTVGYNPTLPSQHNPGSKKRYKAPPVGESIYDRHGDFTGLNLYVPGPYKIPGQKVGSDLPPDPGSNGQFNDRGTFTGCAVDHDHNVFGADLGTAQGDFPVPDDGRLIEWFAPDYHTYCIIDGPTSGGVGPHHVDGHGGLQEPGTMAVTDHGDILLPEAGNGRVIRLPHDSLPKSATDCPGGLYPSEKLHAETFIKGTVAFPLGIARDPICKCWAIDSAVGDPAIAWFDDNGKLVAGHATVPGTKLGDPKGYTPFGMAFAPNGTLYFVDIHVECKNNQLSNCGPATKGGRLMEVTFTNAKPSPPRAIRTGFDFPTSVTVCDASKSVCPQPPAGLGADGRGGIGPGSGLGPAGGSGTASGGSTSSGG